MGMLTCCGSGFAPLARAAAKSAAARLRRLGIALVHPRWEQRAAICERCPMRVIHRGSSYCGTPFLRQVERDPAVDGCGCPTVEKARSPAEHCPLTPRHLPAAQLARGCTCRWCAGDASA
jgi:hypothetical protein